MDFPSVFISHSSKDIDIAKTICSFLESHNIKCWIAPRDITPGASYPSEITKGIKGCETFLVILTKNSVCSPHVNTETDIAFNSNKRIVPFFTDSVELGDSMSYYLARKQWIIGYDNMKQALDELLKCLNPAEEHVVEVKDASPDIDFHENQSETNNYPSQDSIAGTNTIRKKSKELPFIITAIIAVLSCLIFAVYITVGHKDTPYESHSQENAAVNSDIKTAEDVVVEIENYDASNSEGEFPLNTITSIADNVQDASWKINYINYHNQWSISLSGHIKYKFNNSNRLVCSMRLNKKSLEGTIEDNDGANIGYLEGKIRQTDSGYKISVKLVLESADYSYTTLNCEVDIMSEDRIDTIINKEISKAYD